jgi:hypothetical protein
MPITFEEVTGEIRSPERASPSEVPSARPVEAQDDLREKLERELRLMAERSARIAAD